MRERILVTGGAGFMGSALVRVLADQEYDVFCYDNFVTGTASNVRAIIPHDHVVRGDVEGWKFMKTLH